MKNKKSEIITSPDCFGLTAATIVIDDLGTDALNWLPSTLDGVLTEKYGEIPYSVKNRIHAATLVLTSDEHRHRLDRFVLVCNALSAGIVEPVIGEAKNIFWGLVETTLLDPPDLKEGKPPYSADILHYIEILHTYNGLALSPPTLKKTGVYVNKLYDVLSDFSEDAEQHEAFLETVKSKVAIYELALIDDLHKLAQQLVYSGFPRAVDAISKALDVDLTSYEK